MKMVLIFLSFRSCDSCSRLPEPKHYSGSLILSYQGLEEENLDQKSPDPPGWGLMQRASYSLITKKQKMLKIQTQSLENGAYYLY
jgi:hypothetical protein